MLTKFLLSLIFALCLFNIKANAFDFTAGKADCKTLHFSLTLSPSEYEAGSYVGFFLYEDSTSNHALESSEITISDVFSASDLYFPGKLEFGKKLTKSYPKAVVSIGIYDSNGELLTFEDGTSDAFSYSVPIKCLNVAAIVGGVVGGVGSLGLVAIIVFVVRRKKQQKKQSVDNLESPTLSSQPTLPFSPGMGVQTGVPLDGKEQKTFFAPSYPQSPLTQQPTMASGMPQQTQHPFIFHK